MKNILGVAITLFFFGTAFGDSSIYSYTMTKTYCVTVTEKALRRAPRWEADQDSPPLSAKNAIRLATIEKNKLVRDSEGWKWRLNSASLDQIDGYWVWIVHFEALPSNQGLEGLAPFLKIAILMDGTVVKVGVTDREKGE